MVSKRKHLDVARFFIDEPFKSKRLGRNSGVLVEIETNMEVIWLVYIRI